LDDQNPYEDAFEEALLSEAGAPNLAEMLAYALDRIRRHPLGAQGRIVDGTYVYIVKTPPHSAEGGRVPGLLIAYVVERDRSLIRPLLVQLSDDDLTDETLRRAVEASSQSDEDISQRVLFPAEPTHIPAKSIESAVKRVLKRSK
jgi:hypothetical protein